MSSKTLIAFGTRPEVIKLAPVIFRIRNSRLFDSVIVSTGQHREMLMQALKTFNITPDYDLNIMKHNQTLFDISVRGLRRLERLYKEIKPDFVVVQGDTTTTFITSLAAFYFKIPVVHIEAGLRSGDIYQPFPEEMNRILTSKLASLHFAPTELNKRNLINEGVDSKRIFVVGNTVIDALYWILKNKKNNISSELENYIDKNKKLILVTVHRRENWGEPIKRVCLALNRLAQRKDVQILVSMHKNRLVQEIVKNVINKTDNVRLFDPLNYEEFVFLMEKSYLILSDSGGVQEEAPSLGKPVLVLREVTERKEALEAGTIRLVGTDTDKIVNEAEVLLDSKEEYLRMARIANPYGDGKSSQRILNILRKYFS